MEAPGSGWTRFGDRAVVQEALDRGWDVVVGLPPALEHQLLSR